MTKPLGRQPPSADKGPAARDDWAGRETASLVRATKAAAARCRLKLLWVWHRENATVDFHRLRHNLLVGSIPETARDVDLLKAQGVTAVLSLQTEEDLSRKCPHWPEIESRYGQLGLKLHRVPVRDFDPASLRQNLPEAVRTLARLLKQGHTVYLHCTAGAGRSPSTAIAYLHWVEGLPLEEAVEEVRRRRPCSPDVETIRQATADWQRQQREQP